MLDKIESKLKELSQSVPFGESSFQKIAFANGQDTPERLLRHHLLQLDQKLRALKKCQFDRARTEIEIEKIQEKLKTAEGFEKRMLSIDLAEKEYNFESQEKLIFDALIEVQAHYSIIESLPQIESREQFENAELEYWSKRLLRESNESFLANGVIPPGHIEALSNIGISLKRKNDQLEITASNHKFSQLTSVIDKYLIAANQKK